MENIDHLNSDEMSNLIVEKEKELIQANKNLDIVQEENHRLAIEILNLRIKKKDSDVYLDKAKMITQRIRSEIKILERKFWEKKT